MAAKQTLRNLYLHFPFCSKKCLYCDFPVYALGTSNQTHSTNLIDTYLDQYLTKEIDLTMEGQPELKERIVPLKTLYLGGGTPSLMSAQQLEKILKKVRQAFEIDSNSEVTIEMDPGTFDRQKIRQYQDLGINRMSMGVQTFNENEFEKLGRGHSYPQIMQSIEELQASKFNLDQVSIDLMMGIPNQTQESYVSNLQKALSLGFGHLSFYILTLELGTPFHKSYQYAQNPLPSHDTVADMYQSTHTLLTSNGFNHYEISNYGRSGSESQHNNMYWEGDTEYMAFGCGAASYIDGVRFSRPKQLKQYYRYIESGLMTGEEAKKDTNSQIAQTVLMCGLRMAKGVNLREKFRKYFESEEKFQGFTSEVSQLYPKELKQEYFTELSSDRIALSTNGFLVSNRLIVDLQEVMDRYL